MPFLRSVFLFFRIVVWFEIIRFHNTSCHEIYLYRYLKLWESLFSSPLSIAVCFHLPLSIAFQVCDERCGMLFMFLSTQLLSAACVRVPKDICDVIIIKVWTSVVVNHYYNNIILFCIIMNKINSLWVWAWFSVLVQYSNSIGQNYTILQYIKGT